MILLLLFLFYSEGAGERNETNGCISALLFLRLALSLTMQTITNLGKNYESTRFLPPAPAGGPPGRRQGAGVVPLPGQRAGLGGRLGRPFDQVLEHAHGGLAQLDRHGLAGAFVFSPAWI